MFQMEGGGISIFLHMHKWAGLTLGFDNNVKAIYIYQWDNCQEMSNGLDYYLDFPFSNIKI